MKIFNDKFNRVCEKLFNPEEKSVMIIGYNIQTQEHSKNLIKFVGSVPYEVIELNQFMANICIN